MQIPSAGVLLSGRAWQLGGAIPDAPGGECGPERARRWQRILLVHLDANVDAVTCAQDAVSKPYSSRDCGSY